MIWKMFLKVWDSFSGKKVPGTPNNQFEMVVSLG